MMHGSQHVPLESASESQCATPAPVQKYETNFLEKFFFWGGKKKKSILPTSKEPRAHCTLAYIG